MYLFSGAAVLQDKNRPDHPQNVSVFVQIAHDICLNYKVFVHILQQIVLFKSICANIKMPLQFYEIRIAETTIRKYLHVYCEWSSQNRNQQCSKSQSICAIEAHSICANEGHSICANVRLYLFSQVLRLYEIRIAETTQRM